MKTNSFSEFDDFNYAKMLDDLNQKIETNPNDIKLFVSRAHCKVNLSDIEGCLQDLEEAFKLEPNDPELFFERGELYHDLRRFEEAISDFSKAIELAPENAEYYYRRGLSVWANYSKKNIDESLKNAFTDFKIAISIDESYIDPYFEIAEIHELNQDFEKALLVYNKIISLDSKNATAFIRRGKCNIKLKNYSDSIKDFTNSIENKKLNFNAYYLRGWAKYLIKDFDGARADFNKNVQINSNANTLFYEDGDDFIKLF